VTTESPAPAGLGGASSDLAVEESRVAGRAGRVGVATLFSRVTGLARDQMMAILFGAGFATDAFNVAFRIPNLLRDLFAEGAMSSAFVPTFTEAQLKRGDSSAWALGRQVMAALALTLGLLCLIAGLFATPLVRLFAGGFEKIPGKLELTVTLTRIMLPFLPLVALAAAAMGMLNARGRFGLPALAPSLMNLGMIGGGLALLPVMAALGQPPILALALGVVLGGALQFGVQLPPLFKMGFRFRWAPEPREPGVSRVAALMLPATVGLAATQLNLMVSTIIASHLEQGSVSWLYYAFRLMQLPIGVFGVALATVSLPEFSRAAVRKDYDALQRTLSATLRLVVLLTLPAAVWLAVMAVPVIGLLFQHGRFGDADSARTAGALRMYCVGLPAFAAVGVLTRAFYALGETRVPVQASFVSVAINLTLNLLFVGPLRFLGLGHLGLALATSVTSIVNLAQLAFALRARLGSLEGTRLRATTLRVSLASLGIAVLGLAVLALTGALGLRGFVGRAVAVGLGVVLGGAGGFTLMKLTRVEELRVVDGWIARLRGRAK
jgi:putative peptidoglycan lipid II flippase